MKVCISHMEDADGIVSASLISKLFGTRSILVNYSTFMPTLREVSKERLEKLFICDMGLSRSNQEEFIEITRSMKDVEITYIDHHDLDMDLKNTLTNSLRLIHTIDECTSVIIYTQFSSMLDEMDRLLISTAAIVDEMDQNPIASTLVRRYDRQFLFFETVILSYSIYASQNDMDFLLRLVEELKSKMPHEISGVIERSRRFGEMVYSAFSSMKDSIADNKFGYIHVKEPLSSGIVANMLLRLKQLKVALAYKESENGYVISLRGSQDYDKHLGKMVNALAYELGGSGGGHRLACGASIPRERLKEFIDRLEQLL